MDVLGASSSEAFSIFGTGKLLFTGNIPRGVFVERRSQKTGDTGANLCNQHKFLCIAKRVTEERSEQ